MNLEDSKNEVLRKIGRNMMLFQQLELLLKFIVANCSMSGSASTLIPNKEKREASAQKQTMGTLVGQYLKTYNPENEEILDESDELEEDVFSFKFYTKGDSVNFETRSDALAKMVSDRNELVHNMLPRFNGKSIKNCIVIDNELDEQKEKILFQIDELRNQVDSLMKGKKILAEFLDSDEGKKQLELSWLRVSPLVLLLSDIAIQSTRVDGFASLAIAGRLIRQQAPEEMASLKERYGYKSLKALIHATEIFDIYEEPTKNGFLILYRLKSGQEF